MKRLTRWFLGVLVGVLIVCIAIADSVPGQTLRFPVGTDVPAEYDPLPDRRVDLADATVLADITYSTIPGFRPLRLDLYQSKDNVTSRPLVVFVHGGGWVIGQKRGTGNFENFPGVLAALANRGYVVASVEYRLSGEAPFPAAVQDVKSAIRFLRANADRYGINPDQVAVWGSSAGAHLSAMAAYSCDVPALAPAGDTYNTAADCVQGFVGWYGPYDLSALMGAMLGNPQDESSAHSAHSISAATPASQIIAIAMTFFECTASGCPPGRLTEGSPISYVDEAAPPTLLIHGSDDALVPAAQSEALAAELREANVPVELLLIPGVGHDFRGATQVRTEEASLQALSATFNFFDQIFEAP